MRSSSRMYWLTVPKVPSSLPLPDMFLAVVRSGVRVLDVGCGEAGAGKAITRLGGDYIGLDVNLPSLRRAARHHQVVFGAGSKLPFKNATFDLVLLRAVLTVLVDRAERLAVVREALRVCRGYVGIQDFLQTWEIPLYASRYEEGISLKAERGSFPVRQEGKLLYWARHYTAEELSDLIHQAGGMVANLAKAPAPTRSGNMIRGVTLLAHSDQDLPGSRF